jgi:hypothetical protein
MMVTTSVASVSLVQTPVPVLVPLVVLVQEESKEVLGLGVAKASVAEVASGLEADWAEGAALVVEAVCEEPADMVADGIDVRYQGSRSGPLAQVSNQRKEVRRCCVSVIISSVFTLAG